MHAASSSSIDDGFSQYVCLSVCLSIHRYRAQQQPVQLPIHSSHPMFPLQASFSPAQLSTAQTPPPHNLILSLAISAIFFISSHPIPSHPRPYNTLITNRIASYCPSSTAPIHWRLPSGLDSSRVARSHHAGLHLVGSPLPADADPF